MKVLFAFLTIWTIAITGSCQTITNKSHSDKKMSKDTSTHKFTNDLINETSPYLLQHAHNPVNWRAWGESALNEAKAENKLILISIGYSACHWCHVMEKESFEDEDVAKFMNENFVCIKVDREERPDVDQVYMNAVQLITGRGGWPLNCFALPDGRPFYGGTYFQKRNWLYLLQNIVKEYHSDPGKLETYATDLTNNINRVELSPVSNEKLEEKKVLSTTLSEWKTHFDNKEGGPNRSPKFPLPNNYEFLLDYAIINNDQEILDHVKLTLDKMAHGGIYDQAGGGFARYSTDDLWKVPHFEKMLYDNAQLVSLYAKAYRHFNNPYYIEVVKQSLDFIERELTGPDGEFYSALDADSEGEEGKFYVWSEEELRAVNGLDFEFVKAIYRINKEEKWEGHYILQRSNKEDLIRKDFDLNEIDFKSKVDESNRLLLEARSQRIRPGLDDKSLTSWNALMITGYVDAYVATGNKSYINAAEKNASFIWDVQFSDKKVLRHNYKKGRSTIPGFLEDYAFSIKAFTDLYQVTFEDAWLERAEIFTEICLNSFFNKDEDMFFFTSENEKLLVARKMEIQDNVIPSSNSAMARNLKVLGTLKDNHDWIELSKKMTRRVSANIPSYGSAYSNWAQLLINESYPYYEIAICGSKSSEFILDFGKHYQPNSIFLGSEKEGDLPLLEHKYVKGKTVIYVCVDKTCQLPVENVNEAKKQISFN